MFLRIRYKFASFDFLKHIYITHAWEHHVSPLSVYFIKAGICRSFE